MAARFVIRTLDGRTFPVEGDIIVGRHRTCRIFIDDPRVSRHHATLWADGDALYVRDEASRNGLAINGQRVTPSVPARLQAGDLLQIGGSTFSVALTSAAAAGAPQPARTAPPAPPSTRPDPLGAQTPPTDEMRLPREARAAPGRASQAAQAAQAAPSAPPAGSTRRKPNWLLWSALGIGALAGLLLCGGALAAGVLWQQGLIFAPAAPLATAPPATVTPAPASATQVPAPLPLSSATQAMQATLDSLATEAAVVETQSAAATGTRMAQETQQAFASGLLNLEGAFELTQQDSGCSFSAWPLTTGDLALQLDFSAGTASGDFTGGGSGARTGLRCDADTSDMTWSQSYVGAFSGSLNPATGALELSGTIDGSGAAAWQNCRRSGTPVACSAANNYNYSFPVSISGTVDQAAGTASGVIIVRNITLVTEGEWQAAGP